MTLPCLAPDGCPESFDTAPLLAAHLVDAHLWNGSTAYLRARTAFLKEQPASDIEGPDKMTKDKPMPSPPIPKKGQYQPPMSERTCEACNKKGHRSDHCPERKPAAARDGKPAPAKAAPTCGYCHQPAGGHSKGCKKKGGCKICARSASGKCGWHSGEGGKPGPKALRSVTPAGRPDVVAGLDRIKTAIAEHERKASALREALAILEA